MKRTKILKFLSFAFCIVLVAAIALMTTACNDNTTQDPVSSAVTETQKVEVKNIGDGDTKFDLTVVDKDGIETKFVVSTNKTIVGDALLELELISGSNSEYGLMIESVNGQTVTWENDGKYWAIYVNGEYATTGINSISINPGDEYMLKVE